MRGPGWSVLQRFSPRFARYRTQSSSIAPSCTRSLQDGIHRRPRQEVRPQRAGRGRHRRRQGRYSHRPAEDRRRRRRGPGARDLARGGQPFDESFEVGDVMEEPVDFAEFGRAAVQAAKQRIIQRVREGERTKIRDEFSDARRRSALRRDAADRARQARRHAQQVPRGGGNHSVSRAEPSRALSIRASRFAPCSRGSRRRRRDRASFSAAATRCS